MHKQYRGSDSRTYTIEGEPIAQGGEGAIYAVSGNAGIVAKIHHSDGMSDQLLRKVRVMTELPERSSLEAQVCWPRAVLFENGRAVGYTMKNLSGYVNFANVTQINDKRFTYDKRVHIAKNLCAALDSLHKAGQICGDMNPANIMVHPDTCMVYLVDAVSYHITDPSRGTLYRCGVGVPEYLAPELLDMIRGNVTFANAPLPTFTEFTDRFAMAVHIFTLLMGGCHPFACALQPGITDRAVPQPTENIKSGNCYIINPNSVYRRPAYAPDFSILPDDIQMLFRAAFISGARVPSQRPDENAWWQALDRLRHHLVRCSTDPAHIYPAGKRGCPWCAARLQVEQIIRQSKSSRIVPSSASAEKQGSGSRAAAGTAPVQTGTRPPAQPAGGSGTPAGGKDGEKKTPVMAIVFFALIIAFVWYMAVYGAETEDVKSCCRPEVMQTEGQIQEQMTADRAEPGAIYSGRNL